MAKVWQRRGVQARETATAAAQAARIELEARETAETLVEDRGRANALAWAEHCATRDMSGFWWRVWHTIQARP